MKLNYRKEKALEMQERKTRRAQAEDAAGKLQAKAPDLISLSLTVVETRSAGTVSDTQHVRRVVVEHAPALFVMPCSDPACEDGGYDATREILNALAARKVKFEVDQDCRGHRGSLECGRHLHIGAVATYRDAGPRPAP